MNKMWSFYGNCNIQIKKNHEKIFVFNGNSTVCSAIQAKFELHSSKSNLHLD